MFLSPSQFAAETDLATHPTLTCPLRVYHKSASGPERRNVVYNMVDVLSRLERNAYNLSSTTKILQTSLHDLTGSDGRPLTVLTERHYESYLSNVINTLRVNDSFIMLVSPGEGMGAKDLLCFEMLLIDKVADVAMPSWTNSELALAAKHDRELLEAHFGLPIIMSDPSVVEHFTNKSYFNEWMVSQHLHAFVPRVYESSRSVIYPVMVKFTGGTWGEGITIANNASTLDIAIENVPSHSYLLQEALVGKAEPLIHWVARSGKLLATSCSLDNKKAKSLFVTGEKEPLYDADQVSCKDFDSISPLSDLVRSIVSRLNYNGFGCFNFKFAPNTAMTQQKLDDYLLGIQAVEHYDVKAITTEFGPEGAVSNASAYAALPRLFDFNVRPCGSHFKFHFPSLLTMTRMYLDAMASEA